MRGSDIFGGGLGFASIMEEAIQALVEKRCSAVQEQNKKLKAKITELAPEAQVGRAYIKEHLKVGDVFIDGHFPLESQDYLRAHKITAVRETQVDFVTVYSKPDGSCWWGTSSSLNEARNLVNRNRATAQEIKVEMERRNRVAQQPLSKAQKRARKHL